MAGQTEPKAPLVSIGIPIYNEADFIGQALDSLLSQDYPNSELIVCDNASTDKTLEICNEIAATDRRVRVSTSGMNRGSTTNFQRCLDAADGEFFMWAGGHDLWSPNMISECVASLDNHDGAIVAVPESNWIDLASQPVGERESVLDTRGMDALARVFTLLWANMHPIYGLMRTSALRATGPLVNQPGADLVLLLQMALQGDFVPASQALWSRRRTRSKETYADRQMRYHSKDFAIRTPPFPMAQLGFAILKAVWSSGLALSDKAAFSLAFPALLPARYLVGRRRVA